MRFSIVLWVVWVVAGSAWAEATGYLGVVSASRTVEIAAEVAGRVEAVAVALGDSVDAGETLVQMELPGLEREIARADAALEGARSAAKQASIELEDLAAQLARRSTADDAFSAEELEGLRTRHRIKEAELERAHATSEERRAELGALRERRDALRIVAPFDALIARQGVNAGAFVQAGERLLQIVDRGDPIVRFAVPAGEAGWLEAGAPISFRLDGDDDDGDAFDARVVRVAPEVDAATEMIFAEAESIVSDSNRARPPMGSVVRVWPSPSID